MTFKHWLDIVNNEGLICERYLPLVHAARSRKQYMDLVLDANGMAFLCDMGIKGHRLPYNTILDEFKAYVNGRYIHSKSNAVGAYTASMYCGVETPSEITINTTLTGLFGCECVVNVPMNAVCQLYVDDGCDIEVKVADNATCYIDIWDGGHVECINNSNIVIKHKRLEDE